LKNKNIALKIFLLSTIIFFAAQLTINSKLSPLGTQLQKLNSEKEYLVELNQNIREKLAKLDSIVVVKELAEKKLNFEKQDIQSTIYIRQDSLFAEK
jgi:hypothetical protein